MSDRGALERQIPLPKGGDCEERSNGMENLVTAGELYDDGGADPEE